jgi:[ribosomal protein S18]-alanine N-acetyltransferase
MVSQGELLHDIEIRKMIMEDVIAVTAIDRAEDRDPWTENLFRQELQIPISHALVAVIKSGKGGRIAGFITFWLVADEVQLHKIGVSRQVQRQGVGRRLLQAMTEQAVTHGVSKAILEVHSTNRAAIKLYETFGFQVTAVRKGYYGGTGEDALLMAAELGPDNL